MVKWMRTRAHGPHVRLCERCDENIKCIYCFVYFISLSYVCSESFHRLLLINVWEIYFQVHTLVLSMLVLSKIVLPRWKYIFAVQTSSLGLLASSSIISPYYLPSIVNGFSYTINVIACWSWSNDFPSQFPIILDISIIRCNNEKALDIFKCTWIALELCLYDLSMFCDLCKVKVRWGVNQSHSSGWQSRDHGSKSYELWNSILKILWLFTK